MRSVGSQEGGCRIPCVRFVSGAFSGPQPTNGARSTPERRSYADWRGNLDILPDRYKVILARHKVPTD